MQINIRRATINDAQAISAIWKIVCAERVYTAVNRPFAIKRSTPETLAFHISSRLRPEQRTATLELGGGTVAFPEDVALGVELITRRGNRHNYDIRIYVARQGDTLIPAGCLFRIAPQPDKGTYSKGSLIVNLSAYGGIATERGLGLSEESLETVHLEEDIVKIFAASTLLMAAIARQPIDWS